jgi:transposase
MIREAWHEPTKRYVARRTAQGKSRREIRRCRTRAVARGLYRLLERQATAPTLAG